MKAMSAQYTFQTLDDPAGGMTQAFGIYGAQIVGEYSSYNSTEGFLYNGTTYSNIEDPSGVTTIASGIYKGTIVGSYETNTMRYQGFIYQGGNYSTLSGPTGTGNVMATSIYGSAVGGDYALTGGAIAGNSTGFVYLNGNYNTINDPLGTSSGTGNHTFVTGIYDSDVVGFYIDPADNNANGFLYNGSTYVTIDYPSASFPQTYVTGISGNTIVGYYLTGVDPSGFTYDILSGTYTTVNDPNGTNGTEIDGVSGTTLVGAFENSSGFLQGFEATVEVPEPSSVALLGVGWIVGLLNYRRKLRLPNSHPV